MAGDLSPPRADPLLLSGQSYRSIGRDVAGITFNHPGNKRWWIAFAGAMGLAGLLAIALGYLLYEGPGIWGNNIPVTWALDIVSYDWWIGIACGGLTVSATLLLLDLAWRGALNRITETAALISAFAAALYPIIHLGRPWFFFWTLPYPNTLLLWPQWRSSLVWDAINIASFLLVCLSFWYIGLLPDLASLRDRAIARSDDSSPGRPHKRRLFRAQLYGIAALGWRGSATHWQRWVQAYRMVGLFGILLVVSLQTGSALEFASSLEPGWHDTMLPAAHFVSALFEGVGAVAALTVLLRSVYSLELVITERHLDLLGKLLLGLCIANLYCYACEFLIASQFGTDYNKAVLARRFAGPNAWSSWVIIGCALAPAQLFWLRFMRRSPPILLIVGLLVTVGMWADHFMVIVITLQQDFLPSSANRYTMDFWGIATFAGTGGLFLVLLLLATRFLPLVSIHELRRLVRPGEDPDHV